MTHSLETALSGLPAKPRVHELSKRIGITNKELIAALADRGLTISSASASVPAAVARELITELLGGAEPETGAAPVTAEPEQPTEPATEPAATEVPGDTPGTAGLAINPLFLPPAEFAAAPEQQDADPDDTNAAETAESEPEPARSGSSRRRRGRSGGGRRRANAEQDREVDTETDDSTTVSQDPPADEPAAVEVTDEQPGQSTEQTDTDEDSGGRNRRRRRGRRGRGRVGSDNDEQDSSTETPDGESAGDEAPQDQPEPSAEPGTVQSEAVEVEVAGQDVETDEASNEDDSDTAGGSGSANRRRRRRRRRSTGDEAPREDDPDNTVVHVREPRLSQTSASVASTGEVQGVRGSTRLEAKRQRRRESRDSSRRRPQILTEAEFLARRESVERVMAVRQRGDLAQVALLEDGILVEHFVSQTGSDSMIGSVFLGKVQNVLPSMEAAFCDIGRGRNAVIYAGEVNWDAAGLAGKARRIETALSSGDTILAQVSKDPVGHKGARLTTQISLPGRFVVYVPGGGATGISRKLPDTERKRLKSIMDRIVPEDAGVIIRTAAEGIAEEELARDVERLKLQWEEITRRAEQKTTAPVQLYAEPGTLIKVVRDLFNSDITRLVVDGDDAWEPVAEYVNAVAPELADRLVRYEDTNGHDVFAAYRIDEQIAKALERKVHLPSGGSLVIDRTEAMTVVDVNTGKYTGSGGNLEETVTKNNLEAAEEMVRQLRLRDIGGIIVIDFIDMVLESNRELVLRRLTEALGRDRTRHQVAEVTSLGLVQMTRKRMGTGLVEAFSEPCPHCGGRGIVLHDMPVVASAFEENSADRRSTKPRRGRGRDTERVEEIVIPRVVEPVGRRPDPRGPKPPPAVKPTPRESGNEEIDWIEAAARAGIQAAEDADSDGYEGQQSGRSDDHDGDEIIVEVTGEDAGDDTGEDIEIAVATDDSTNDLPVLGDEVVDWEEPAAEAAPAPEQPRRRGRRAAGRPAGAPAASTQPVDIIVAQPLPATTNADGESHSNGASNGDGTHPQPEETQTQRIEPAAPPRRRRAASRPAGPAAEVSAAEPLVLSVPADQSAG